MLPKLFGRSSDIFRKYPLAISIVLASLIRSIAAYSNYGPFAIDDYLNVLDPALRHLMLGTRPEIPTLRFEILPYAFSYFMKPLYLLGVKRADLLISFAYFVMGLISLTQIVAMHRIGSLLLEEKWRNAMTLFSATWAIAPIFTNSADIAGPAFILLTFSLLHLVRALPESFKVEKSRLATGIKSSFIWCGFFLSAAIFFRFSLAPLYFALGIWLIVAAAKGEKLRAFLLFAAGGAITAVIMSALELVNHRLPFSTALEFIKYNFGAHIETQSYGAMPWHMYLLIFAAFPLPVLCFFFWRPMASAARRYGGFTLLLLVFLLSHSAIAFKLERYVIPVLPILVIFLFAGIQQYADRRWVRVPYIALLVINALCVLPVAWTMQQRAGVDGAIYTGQLKGERFTYGIDPWRWGFYGLRAPHPIFVARREDILVQANERKLKEFRIFRFMYFSGEELKEFKTAGYKCWIERVFRPDFLERVSIRLNPAMNFRRNDTTVYACIKET